jgi:hypothetical protein
MHYEIWHQILNSLGHENRPFYRVNSDTVTTSINMPPILVLDTIATPMPFPIRIRVTREDMRFNSEIMLSLVDLDCGNLPLSDETFPELSKMPRLARVSNIHPGNIMWCDSIFKYIGHVRELDISYNLYVCNDDFKYFENIETLIMIGCTQYSITRNRIQQLPKLRTINAKWCNLDVVTF